jgi:hypothetical protein
MVLLSWEWLTVKQGIDSVDDKTISARIATALPLTYR